MFGVQSSWERAKARALTMTFPITPISMMTMQKTMAVVRIYGGISGISPSYEVALKELESLNDSDG